MAYHGYIPTLSKIASNMHTDRKNKIKILEIGVDTGISLFALVNNLKRLYRKDYERFYPELL